MKYYLTKDTSIKQVEGYDLVIHQEDQLRFVIQDHVLYNDYGQIDCISLERSHLGLFCKQTIDKFMSITENVFSDEFNVEWRD